VNAPTRNQARPHRAPRSLEPIVPGQLWPVELLRLKLGWGARTRAAAFRDGLPAFRYGRQKFILSDDVIAFLTRRSDSESDSNSTDSLGRTRDSDPAVAAGVAAEGGK
jgi:hypothetical protein